MEIVRIGDSHRKIWPAEEIGSKAANLSRMAALGLPVPPAFVLPIPAGAQFAERPEIEFQTELNNLLDEGIGYLEQATGRRFGDRRRPLLVSVRSGAAVSMPGMLDTVLDVGCTAAATCGLIRMTGNPGFAWDCRRRFIESYADSVLGVEPATFTAAVGEIFRPAGAAGDRDLDAEDREQLAIACETALARFNSPIPDDCRSALLAAVRAVWRSWASERARTYRKLQKLDHLKGTAATVQAMVFGNRGNSSGSGVAFSRDPSNGKPNPVIDFVIEAQGEDIVSGRRTPQTEATFAQTMPAAYGQLRAVLTQLEEHFCDVQDVEFTVEDGKLWLLQTRAAKRSPYAALRFAVDFVHEGRWSPDQAAARLEGIDRAALAIRRFAEAGEAAARGTGAAAGVAVGRAVFDSARVERLAASGDPVILVRPEISTSDITGLALAAGILTAAGGRTAHAALVARQMGKPCVVGCRALSVDSEHRAYLGDANVTEGTWISIDGTSGDVFLGQRKISVTLPEAELAEWDRWKTPMAGAPVVDGRPREIQETHQNAAKTNAA